MRTIFAVLLAAIISASILPHAAQAQAGASSADAPPYDPAAEQEIRRSCNVGCFTTLDQCLRNDAASPSPCPTSAITCFIGCRGCAPIYRACRSGTPPGAHDDCLRRDLACVAEKRRAQEGRTDLIRFSGGDGSSTESAVVIEGARSEEEGIVAESYWISRNRSGWRKGDQALINANGRQLDRITYSSPEGKQIAIFFDITSFFGKM